MSGLLQWLGLWPTEEDKKISELIRQGPPTRVVGRGTVMVDKAAILSDPQFKEYRRQAREIVRG